MRFYGTPEITLLGSGLCTGSGNNIELSNSLENYTYLLITMLQYSDYMPFSNFNKSGYNFCDVNYVKSNNVSMYWTKGTSPSGVAQAGRVQYVDDTHLNFKLSSTGYTAQTFYVYGIK